MEAARPNPPEWRVLLLLLAIGLALRLAWLWAVHGSVLAPVGVGEATRVALAYARTGTLADAYFDGQGPSAHLMPFHPWLAGSILRLAGFGDLATAALLAWAVMQWAACVLLLDRLAGALGAGRVARRIGAGVLCLLPAFVPQEVVDFRFWDGGTAAMLAALNLLLIVRAGRGAAPPAWIAAVPALTLFVAPSVGVATGACWAVVALRRRWGMGLIRFAAVGALVLAATLGPWALRNRDALGTAVPLRSNGGLELAIANYPVGGSAAGFAARLRAVHPYLSPDARERVRVEGEVGYARRLGEEAVGWIAAHPGQAARGWFARLGAFLFPPAWLFGFSGWDEARALRAGVVGLVQLAGLAGLIVTRRRGSGWIALYLAALLLPFALFQPTARYVYLVWTMLSVPAGLVGERIWRRMLEIRQPTHLAPAAHHRVEDQPAEQA